MSDPIPTGSDELLSAFVDGEDVDPEALLEALSAPGAHEALVDFVRLRANVRDGSHTCVREDHDGAVETEGPSAGWQQRVEAQLAAARVPAWRRRVTLPAPLAAAAAALVVVASLAALLQRAPAPGPDPGLVPSPRDARPATVVAGAGTPPPAARVLTFEPGRDWHGQEVPR